jgi:hypothetical protein
LKSAAVVFVVALAAHLVYFALDRNIIASDTHKYVVPAESLLEGRGFTRDGLPETLRTPGYPLLLAALKGIGFDLRGIVFLQHLAAALVAAVLVPMVRRMTGNGFIATVAGLFTAIDLPTIHHANNILNETLFTVMGVVLFWVLWRIADGHPAPVRWAAAAGLLLGAMTAVRPLAILFFVAAAAYLAWARRDVALRVVPAFVICALLIPAAWIYRNHRVAGVATMSTNGAVLALYFHAAGALAIDDPGDFFTNLERRQEELRVRADHRVRTELGITDLTRLTYAQRSEADTRLGREIVLAHSSGFAKVTVWGIAVNLLGGSADALTRITTLSRSAAHRALLPYNAAALALAVIGLIWLFRRHPRLGLLILITVGYFILVTAGALSYSRFRVPVVPMYAIAVAAGVQALRGVRRAAKPGAYV